MKLEKKCSVCGRRFEGWRRDQRFCTTRCRRTDIMRRFRKRHPDRIRKWVMRLKWNGNWIKAIERDGYCCQLCGVAGSTGRNAKPSIQVHHLDGEGSNRLRKHALDNLQTLCNSCHRKQHSGTLIRKDGDLYVRFGDKLMKIIEDTP